MQTQKEEFYRRLLESAFLPKGDISNLQDATYFQIPTQQDLENGIFLDRDEAIAGQEDNSNED